MSPPCLGTQPGSGLPVGAEHTHTHTHIAVCPLCFLNGSFKTCPCPSLDVQGMGVGVMGMAPTFQCPAEGRGWIFLPWTEPGVGVPLPIPWGAQGPLQAAEFPLQLPPAHPRGGLSHCGRGRAPGFPLGAPWPGMNPPRAASSPAQIVPGLSPDCPSHQGHCSPPSPRPSPSPPRGFWG